MQKSMFRKQLKLFPDKKLNNKYLIYELFKSRIILDAPEIKEIFIKNNKEISLISINKIVLKLLSEKKIQKTTANKYFILA